MELCSLSGSHLPCLVVMYMQERTCQTWTLGTVPGQPHHCVTSRNTCSPRRSLDPSQAFPLWKEPLWRLSSCGFAVLSFQARVPVGPYSVLSCISLPWHGQCLWASLMAKPATIDSSFALPGGSPRVGLRLSACRLLFLSALCCVHIYECPSRCEMARQTAER